MAENTSASQPAAAPAVDKVHASCEQRVAEALDKNPVLRSLIFNMGKRGCNVTRDFFKCRPCKREVSGFYDSRIGVTLCENYLPTKRHVEDVMIHETVHAFDTCRTELDTSDCLQVACAEIRAANLSGECHFSREVARGQFRYFGHIPDCIKRRATNATSALPHCKANADTYVQRAWMSCYRDTEPFGFVPY